MWRLEKWTRSVLPSGSHGRRRRKILIGRTEGRAARKREKPAAVAGCRGKKVNLAADVVVAVLFWSCLIGV